MNYETTIRAEAADGVTTEYVGARTLAGPTVPRWLIVGGLGLFGLLLAIGAYFALAGGEPVAVVEQVQLVKMVTLQKVEMAEQVHLVRILAHL